MSVFSILPQLPEVQLVNIECHTRLQIPSFQVLGLAATEIQEAKERILSAFQAVGIQFPKRRVILNLSPSGIPKFGTGYDLGMALSILQTEHDVPENTFAWGELSLDGRVHSCGLMAFWLELLIAHPSVHFFCAQEDAHEMMRLMAWRKSHHLAIPERLKVYALENLSDFSSRSALNLDKIALPHDENDIKSNERIELPIIQKNLQRWITLALVGEHHGLLLGPRGVGKSTALKWIEALAPPRDFETHWERIRHSGLDADLAVTRRVHSNIRAPHLLGGTAKGQLRPGELTLAHGGILIADEFPEWSRDAKECLREPLEEGKFTLVRKEGSFRLPSKVQWIGTGNLCPCGGLPERFHAFVKAGKKSKCVCEHHDAEKYLKKISGPVLDRIDLVTLVHAETEKNGNADATIDGSTLKTQIEEMREKRRNLPTLHCHRLMPDFDSYRSKHKVIEIAKTLAILAGRTEILECDIHEAVNYRPETWMLN